MSFYSSENEFLKQIIPVFNVGDPTGGDTALATVQTQTVALSGMVDTTNYNVLTNTITSYNTGTVVFNSPVSLAGGVTGDFTADGNIVANGDITSTGNMTVTGDITSTGNMTTTGDIAVTGNMTATGDITATGNMTCTTLYQTSDKRLKTNIQPIDQPLSTLKGIRGVHFTWKQNGTEDIGFLAQELEKAFPVAVVKPDAVAELGDSTDDYWRVSYLKVVPLLVEAVKRLEDRVVELEGQMDVVYKFNRLTKG
jgi:cytoskeletal protein CcmA (bactofilin family)